jgi:hypothetical protein
MKPLWHVEASDATPGGAWVGYYLFLLLNKEEKGPYVTGRYHLMVRPVTSACDGS